MADTSFGFPGIERAMHLFAAYLWLSPDTGRSGPGSDVTKWGDSFHKPKRKGRGNVLKLQSYPRRSPLKI
ncbi:hypothetical protein J6590_033477 [Homalodisca vitripennis]|nr:hypothetical protein J6590_033477 [Homalodisca vitripennis]